MNSDKRGEDLAARGPAASAELSGAHAVEPACAAAASSSTLSLTPEAHASAAEAFRVHDPISSWLDILERLLPGREAERRGVRDEIEDHLRARTHDLMIEGKTERQAVAIAVAELGDAADVAHRFAASDTARTRRKLMNIGAVAFCGIALASGIAAFQMQPPPVPAPISVYESTRESGVAATITVSSQVDTNWEMFFEAAAKSVNLKPQVHWNAINAVIPNDEVRKDNPLPIQFGPLPLGDALDIINDALNVQGESGIDFRVRRGLLVISTVRHFDQQEMTLATYDLSDLLNSMSARLLEAPAAQAPIVHGGPFQAPRADPMMIENWRSRTLNDISVLVTSLVHPSQWRSPDAVATVNSFGSKLFINAPARFHPQIEWVLDEIRRDAIKAAAGNEAARSAIAAAPVVAQPASVGGGVAGGGRGGSAGGAAAGTVSVPASTTPTAPAAPAAPTSISPPNAPAAPSAPKSPESK
jgi:hypothetical protein